MKHIDSFSKKTFAFIYFFSVHFVIYTSNVPQRVTDTFKKSFHKKLETMPTMYKNYGYKGIMEIFLDPRARVEGSQEQKLKQIILSCLKNFLNN